MNKIYTDEEIVTVLDRQITALKRIHASRLKVGDPYAVDQVGVLKQLAAGIRAKIDAREDPNATA